MSIKENLERLGDSVSETAVKCGRDPGEIAVIAVTKTWGLAIVQEAVAAGVRHVGENRVQEAREKFTSLPGDVTRHMVGHLQRNKVRQALDIFDLIHSVDRVSLAREVSQRAEAKGCLARVLVQVNTIGDEEKHGLPPQNLEEFLEIVSSLGNVQVEGLMTIAPFTDDESRIRKAFSSLRQLRDGFRGKNMAGISMEHLSMGMSGDYRLAIQEGATLIRVGTAIFGARPS